MLDRNLLLGVSMTALIVSASPALAQDAGVSQPTAAAVAQAAKPASSADPAVAQANQPLPGEIIVTAQRRNERLQDVPIAVTALTGEDLARLHANNIARVEFMTPGFTWGSQGSDSFPSIRGVRTSLVSAQNDPVIGFYIDGIYQSRTQQQSIPLFDIGRVEVQRGPQGTLYGRNTFGGNLSVTTARPTDHFEAGANVDFGNYAERRVDGYINFPVTPTLLVRVAGVYQRHDGYVHSATTPGVELNDLKEHAERINVTWKPAGSRFSADLHAGHWLRSDAGAGSYGYKVAGTLIDPATGYQSIFGQPYAVNPSVPNGSPNVAGQDVGIAVTPGAYTNDWNYQPYERIKENYVSATMNYDLDVATARSITGYTDFTANRSADNDQSSKTFAAFGYGSGIQEPHDHARTFTQELQLASRATTPLQWIIGAYYLHDKIFEIYEQKILPASLGVGSYKENAWLTTEAYAGYAQGSYFVVPEKLRLIAGIRYSHEKKSFHFQNFFTAPPGTYDFGTPDTDTTGAPSFSSVTWRAGAEYTPSRRTMFYATASTGFESGGVNDTAGNAATPSSYAPQKVRAYELGWKNQFLGGHVQTEVSLFWNQLSNLQINVYTPAVSYFGSAGKARSRGAEFTLRASPMHGLHIDGTAAYLDAKYTYYISRNNFYGLSNPANRDPISVDLRGKRIPQSPKFKTTLSIYDDFDLNGSGTLSPNVTWLHSSSYYTTDFNTPLDYQKAYDKFDASLRWTAPGGAYYVEGYGQNLTKKAVLNSAVIGRRDRIQVSYGTPRVYGIRAGVKF